MHYVYLIKNGDGSIYIGSSSDLKKRIEAHHAG